MLRRQWLFIAAMILLIATIMGAELSRRTQPPQSQPDHYGQTKQEPQASHPEGQRGETFWQRTRSNPDTFFAFWVAAFTTILALSTVGLWVATLLIGRRQASDMAGLITATKSNATAAASQAEAMQQLHAVSEAQERAMSRQAAAMAGLLEHTPQIERAYISGGGVRKVTQRIFRNINVGIEATASILSQPDGSSIIVTPLPYFDIHINNYGKTPALLSSRQFWLLRCRHTSSKGNIRNLLCGNRFHRTGNNGSLPYDRADS